MPNPFEARDSQNKARGTTHSRIFGGDKQDLQDAYGIRHPMNTELNISETKQEYNTTPSKPRETSMEDDTCRIKEAGNANFPGEDTHCRIFGSANSSPEQCDKKDTAKGERPSVTPVSPTDEQRESLSASGDRRDGVNSDSNNEQHVIEHEKDAEDAQASKNALRKRKSALLSRTVKESPGKSRNNPREGTHNRIFGSFSTHDKAPWISSPSVDPKQGHKPFKPQSKTLYTATNPNKERELSRSKKEDTHTRIFGAVVSKCRDISLGPPMYPKVEADDRTTQSRIFGSTESTPKQLKQPKNEGDRNPVPGATLAAKFDKQLTDRLEANTSSLPEMQQEFKNLSIPPRDTIAGEIVEKKN